MDIDLPKWLSITSACVLGWVCGFAVYSFIIVKFPPVVPLVQPQPLEQVLPSQQFRGSLDHAVVRIIKPSHPYTAVPPIVPHYNIYIPQPPTSYFL